MIPAQAIAECYALWDRTVTRARKIHREEHALLGAMRKFKREHPLEAGLIEGLSMKDLRSDQDFWNDPFTTQRRKRAIAGLKARSGTYVPALPPEQLRVFMPDPPPEED